MMRYLSTITLVLLLLPAVAGEVRLYLDEIDRPQTKEYPPDRISIEALLQDNNNNKGGADATLPSIHVTCVNDSSNAKVTTLKDPNLVTMETIDSGIKLSHETSFSVDLNLACDGGETSISFENFTPETSRGILLRSFCHESSYSDEELIHSWVRGWATVDPPPSPEDKAVIARLLDKNPFIKSIHSPERLWDTVEIALSSKSGTLNSTTITLGCFKAFTKVAPVSDNDETTRDKVASKTLEAIASTSKLVHSVPSKLDSYGCHDVVTECPSISVPCGFRYFPKKNSVGFNHLKFKNLDRDVSEVAKACLDDPVCVAFNNKDWSKHTLRPQSEWEEPYKDSCLGLFVKEACAMDTGVEKCPMTFIPCGYSFYPHYTSPDGDMDTDSLSEATQQLVTAACNKDRNCKGHDSSGTLKATIRPQDEWTAVFDSQCEGLYVKKNPGCNQQDGACE